jgi:hypothetical protein
VRTTVSWIVAGLVISFVFHWDSQEAVGKARCAIRSSWARGVAEGIDLP